MEPIIHLRDKVAIVTGASRGIGEAIAKTFARAGGSVVVASRKQEGLDTVVEAITSEGGIALAKTCHTGSGEQIDALFDAAITRFGKVDILVNNAAANPYFGPMLEIDEAAWDKTFDVNVKGYFFTSRALARHAMERKAPATIVNVASVAGLMGMPLQGVYAMTKSSVISMTKTLAHELGGFGIRVNAIAPGLVETKFASALTTNDEILQSVLERTAIKRVGQPSEIASLALYLASDQSSFMTGTTVTIDAGWLA